jgi:hypothetical protein
VVEVCGGFGVDIAHDCLVGHACTFSPSCKQFVHQIETKNIGERAPNDTDSALINHREDRDKEEKRPVSWDDGVKGSLPSHRFLLIKDT